MPGGPFRPASMAMAPTMAAKLDYQSETVRLSGRDGMCATKSPTRWMPCANRFGKVVVGRFPRFSPGF